MEIRGIYKNYLHNSEKAVKIAKPAEDNSGKINGGADKAEKADKIEISSTASFRAKLEEAKRSYVKKLGAETSEQRISELKEKYKGDNCPVPADLVANAILSRILGPGEGR